MHEQLQFVISLMPTLLQLIMVGIGIPWLLFVASERQGGTFLRYCAVGLMFELVLCFLRYTIALNDSSPNPLHILNEVVYFTMYLGRSGVFFLAWQSMRAARLKKPGPLSDQFMKGSFLLKLMGGMSGYFGLVALIVGNPVLLPVMERIACVAAPVICFLLADEVHKWVNPSLLGIGSLFSESALFRAKLVCIWLLVVWGIAEFAHPTMFYFNPVGIYFEYLGFVQLLTVIVLGVVSLQALCFREV